MPERLSGLLLKKSFEFLHCPAGKSTLVQRLRIAFFHQKDDVVLRLSQCVDQLVAERGGGGRRNDGIRNKVCAEFACSLGRYLILLSEALSQTRRRFLRYTRGSSLYAGG